MLLFHELAEKYGLTVEQLESLEKDLKDVCRAAPFVAALYKLLLEQDKNNIITHSSIHRRTIDIDTDNVFFHMIIFDEIVVMKFFDGDDELSVIAKVPLGHPRCHEILYSHIERINKLSV